MPESSFDELIEAMKAAAGILQDAEIPFVLGGGLSAWARGGPKSEHDVDFLLKADDAEAARARVRGGRLGDGAPAGGLALQGVARERRARRPDLQPGERPDHRRVHRARAGHRGDGAAHPRRRGSRT